MLESLFGKVGSMIVIVFVDMLVIYLVVRFFRLRKTNRGNSIIIDDERSASEILDEMELSDVSMRLESDEVCYYEGIGISYHSKDIVTGYRRNSSGYSAGGFHSSSGRSTAIRKNVRTPYTGRLFITNHRIVFLAEKFGFDIDFNKLSNVSVYNKYIEVFSGSKFYRVYSCDTVFIHDLIELMNICYQEQKTDKNNVNKPKSKERGNDEVKTHDSFSLPNNREIEKNHMQKHENTIIDEMRQTFADVEIGTIFTTSEIKRMVSERFGRNEGSIIPSDCSYNMTNKGIVGTAFEHFNIFIQIKHGQYEYVGENYSYNNEKKIGI